MKDARDHELGMDRPITRRDFPNGVAIGLGSLAASTYLTGCVRHGVGDSPSADRIGRTELYDVSFETMERNIRDQLGRMLGPGGFDPARDIEGITVGRWAHGYAYAPNSLFDPDFANDELPNVVGRKPFGRIAIANSDAGAIAYMDTAIDEAHRAVQELSHYRDS